jgi:hypothetical protein
MNRSVIGVALMVVGLGVATCASLVKTRSEVIARSADRWTGANQIEHDRLMNEENPDLLVPNTRNIIDGVSAGPMEKRGAPARVGDSDLVAMWPGVSADMTWKTRNGPREDGDAFAERAGRDFASMLLAFPRKR